MICINIPVLLKGRNGFYLLTGNAIVVFLTKICEQWPAVSIHVQQNQQQQIYKQKSQCTCTLN